MAKETTFAHPPKGHVAILAYDSANDQWQAVYVDASGNLQVDIAAAEQIETLVHGHIGGAWQKQPLAWGYSAFAAESVFEGDATAGTNTLSTTAVPTGEIHVYTHVYAANTNTATTYILLKVHDGSNAYRIHRIASPGLGVSVEAPNPVVVGSGGYIQGVFGGCSLNDNLWLEVSGYRMDIDL